MSTMRWNLKEAGCAEHTNSWETLRPDEQQRQPLSKVVLNAQKSSEIGSATKIVVKIVKIKNDV